MAIASLSSVGTVSSKLRDAAQPPLTDSGLRECRALAVRSEAAKAVWEEAASLTKGEVCASRPAALEAQFEKFRCQRPPR